ncbi:oligosaccharide flippase family protein [Solibaculum mannosilyticum]|uniref:Polysaccharide biosynthesis protein MviN n=1 Tax=Solibaculum mannosilyticum TaxID=2780922 RepID=A0A7I8D2W5_9FIRM|nr:oligosaccharide flippase family protein [Solibaculum mannosilyticum]BCI59799.1 polysaccharide biosynthesis protein MviN [Solibaculum mannosilyticum]
MQQKSLAKNGFYKATLNVFNLVIPLLVGPYVTGLLEPELYGAYNRVFSEFNVFLVIASFGIYNYGVREISRVRNDPIELNRLFSSLFLIGIITNGLTTGVYVIYALVRSQAEYEVGLYLVMIIQIVANVFYIEFVNEAKENYGFIMVKTMIVRLLYLASIFIFVRKADDILPYAIVVSATVLLNNLISYVYLKRNIRFNFKNIEIVRHIAPLIVSLLLTNVEILYTQLDKIMLSPYVNDIAVTEYYIPLTIVGMIAAVPLALVNVAIPRVSAYIADNNRTDYIRVLNKTIQNYMAMMLPMCLGLAVLAPEVMDLYSRGVYTYAYPVLVVAALARIAFSFQSIVSNLVMYVNGLERQLVAMLAAFGVLNLITNFVLVWLHWFTPATAMGSTAIMVILFVITCYFYTQKKLGIRYNLFSKRICGYFVVSALFIPISLGIRALNLGMWANIAIIMVVCCGVYGGYLLTTKDPFLTELVSRVPFLRKKK